jgi:putative chitinase
MSLFGSRPAPTSSSNSSPTTGSSQGIELAHLRAFLPRLPESKAALLLPHLNAAMAEGNINTPRRKAAFLAQLAHESGEFHYFEELASGKAYEGRKDLGNLHPGDGVRYKGRGPIQITGRVNYRAAGAALGIDLENNPSRAAAPDVGFRTAVWFWTSHRLNDHADKGNLDAITYRINGGHNGKDSRDAYYQRALKLLSR